MSSEQIQALEQDENTSRYLQGWRLQSVALSIAFATFLVNIEVSVVATSLVSIVNDLEGFDKSGWVVTSYLITYTSLIMIWSKSSTIIGRKTCIISAFLIFTAFSGGCGGAESMVQLIVFRALQGVGAAGIMALGLTIAYEMVPQQEYPKYAAILSSVSALGSLVGPLIGGAFSEKVTWRWVFWINVPLGLVIILSLLMSIPNGFLHQNERNEGFRSYLRGLPSALAAKMDTIGAITLLAASLLLVTALLEPGVSFDWKSAPTITLFTLSGLLWIGFVSQQYRLSKRKDDKTDPIFPWEFFKNRAWMGTLLLSVLSGAPYIVVIIDIPQRFQTLGVDSFGAGARLIPFNALIAIAAVLVNIVIGKTRIPPIFLFLVGGILQLIGVCLLMTLTNSQSVPRSIYAYQVITGMGVGIMLGLCLVLPPFVIKNKDPALCGGAVFQTRVFGGALGLAVASAVWNNFVESRLRELLSPEQLALILKSTTVINSFPEPTRVQVVEILIQSYNQRMKVLIGFTAAQIFALGLLWKNPQISIHNKKDDTAQDTGATAEGSGNEEKSLDAR